MARGLKIDVQDGKLVILQEGTAKKLLSEVEQITFSGKYALEHGQEVLYITERAVFELTGDGVALKEVAPGIDIENHDVDLGMVMLPVKNHDSLEIVKVWKSACQWVTVKTHLLAGKSSVRLEELKDERFITFSDTATLHDFFIANCERQGFVPKITYKSLMPNFVFDMVSYDLCSAIMPQPVIQKYAQPDIVAIPLETETRWELALISNRDRYQSYATKHLLKFIISYFSHLVN